MSRICSVCGARYIDGYIVGMEYACCDEHRNVLIPERDYYEQYDDDSDDMYFSQWEELDDFNEEGEEDDVTRVFSRAHFLFMLQAQGFSIDHKEGTHIAKIFIGEMPITITVPTCEAINSQNTDKPWPHLPILFSVEVEGASIEVDNLNWPNIIRRDYDRLYLECTELYPYKYAITPREIIDLSKIVPLTEEEKDAIEKAKEER